MFSMRVAICSVGGNTRYLCNALCNNYYFCGNQVIEICSKTSNITQIILLTNVTGYLSNEVTVMSLLLSNFITTSNEVTNLVSSLIH